MVTATCGTAAGNEIKTNELTCRRGVAAAPQLDVINRCIAVLLAGECSHVVDEVGVARVSRGWQVVHEARHPDQKQEEDEHYVEHEQRIERHQLHSPVFSL